MRGDQIDEEHSSNEMPAWENGNLKGTSVRRPPNKEALKVSCLSLVNSQMNLGQRAGKDERHRRSQTNHRQLQRRAKINPSVPHHIRASA